MALLCLLQRARYLFHIVRCQAGIKPASQLSSVVKEQRPAQPPGWPPCWCHGTRPAAPRMLLRRSRPCSISPFWPANPPTQGCNRGHQCRQQGLALQRAPPRPQLLGTSYALSAALARTAGGQRPSALLPRPRFPPRLVSTLLQPHLTPATSRGHFFGQPTLSDNLGDRRTQAISRSAP